MKQHRLAFVGVGRVADVHFAALQNLTARARLVAVCDSRPDAVELRHREWGVPGFASFRELLAAVDVDDRGASLLDRDHFRRASQRRGFGDCRACATEGDSAGCHDQS